MPCQVKRKRHIWLRIRSLEIRGMPQSVLTLYVVYFSNSIFADSTSDFLTRTVDGVRGSNWIGYWYIVAFVCMHRG